MTENELREKALRQDAEKAKLAFNDLLAITLDKNNLMTFEECIDIHSDLISEDNYELLQSNKKA